MIRDEDVDWKLEAYLDAELPPDESARMALLLEEDPDLGARFAHLQRTRDAGRAYFQSIMAGAPEVPSALQSAPQALALRPRVWRWAGVVAGAAAVLVAAVVVFSPSKQTHASPTVVLERALGRFGAFDSVELWGRLEMPGIAALMQAFNSDPESSKSRSTTKTVRVLLDGQNRMLVQSSADVDEPFSAAHALVGSDGQTSWSWNPEEGEVEISPNSIFGLEVEGGLELDRPLIDYLRWGLFERLHSQSGDVDLREVTWPADRRAGRRVFEMEDRQAVGKPKSFAFGKTTVTIDPERDLVERVVFESSVAGFSLVRLTLEVAEVDPKVSSALFDYRHHVPAGTPTRTQER